MLYGLLPLTFSPHEVRSFGKLSLAPRISAPSTLGVVEKGCTFSSVLLRPNARQPPLSLKFFILVGWAGPLTSLTNRDGHVNRKAVPWKLKIMFLAAVSFSFYFSPRGHGFVCVWMCVCGFFFLFLLLWDLEVLRFYWEKKNSVWFLKASHFELLQPSFIQIQKLKDHLANGAPCDKAFGKDYISALCTVHVFTKQVQ